MTYIVQLLEFDVMLPLPLFESMGTLNAVFVGHERGGLCSKLCRPLLRTRGAKKLAYCGLG